MASSLDPNFRPKSVPKTGQSLLNCHPVRSAVRGRRGGAQIPTWRTSRGQCRTHRSLRKGHRGHHPPRLPGTVRGEGWAKETLRRCCSWPRLREVETKAQRAGNLISTFPGKSHCSARALNSVPGAHRWTKGRPFQQLTKRPQSAGNGCRPL